MPIKQKIDFNTMDPASKVMVGLAYESKRAQLEKRRYFGICQRELEETLGKMNADLSKEEITAALNSNMASGIVEKTVKPIGKNILEDVYVIPPTAQSIYEDCLMSLGWLNVKLKKF